MTEALFKLRTVIVDDEPLARRLLRALLEDSPEIELIAECRNGREAIAAARDLAPDLLILAIDAFDLHAVDYLLKPVDSKRLQRAVARAMQRFQENRDTVDHKSSLVGAIDEIARKVAGRSDTRNPERSSEEALAADRKIAIKDNDSTAVVNIDDIDWVDAAGDYMCVHVKGETLIMRSTLKALMSRLDGDQFKRIHRSTLVNLDRIVKATPLQKGEYILDLDCDQQLKVSRNYREAIKIFLTER